MSMKRILSFSIFLFPFSSIYCWTGKVVFEDNFVGSSLNLNKWEYEEGCSEIYGPRNLQCYSRNNVQVRNGNLIITAKKEKLEDKDYTSGSIRQRGIGTTYGAYVVRARLARGDHLWSAIWMLGKDSSCRYEEIDIAQYRGQSSLSKELELTGHWGKSWDALNSEGTAVNAPFDLAADFHEYAVLWLPSKIQWYIDDRKYYEISLTDPKWKSDPKKLPCDGLEQKPFSQPSNFILNLGVGGAFFDNNPNFDPNTWFKPSMEIDWVRVYQE